MDTQLDIPTNNISIKVPRVVKPSNENVIITLGASSMSPPSLPVMYIIYGNVQTQRHNKLAVALLLIGFFLSELVLFKKSWCQVAALLINIITLLIKSEAFLKLGSVSPSVRNG